MANPAQLSRYRVDGMDCASCAAKIDTAVRRVPGVEDVSVSATAGTMTVHHVDDAAIAPAIAKRVTGLGYKLTLIPGRSTPQTSDPCGSDHDHDHEDHGHDHNHLGHHHNHEHAHQHGPNCDHAGHKHDPQDKEVAGLHGHDHGPTSGPWWGHRTIC